VSDDGSAFDIGSRAVERAIRERQQRGTDSILGRKILEQLGFGSWQEMQQRATLQADNVFPAVFPVVAEAADAGDPAAREILLKAAGELSALVNAVAEHSGLGRENIMIVKTGGTVGRSAFFDAQLDAALKRVLPEARIGVLQTSLAEAAAHAAKY
jgi:N-acetylglucosamine kinase-like BadF-type ATPase